MRSPWTPHHRSWGLAGATFAYLLPILSLACQGLTDLGTDSSVPVAHSWVQDLRDHAKIAPKK